MRDSRQVEDIKHYSFQPHTTPGQLTDNIRHVQYLKQGGVVGSKRESLSL